MRLIGPSSEKMNKKSIPKKGQSKYDFPWDSLSVGMSFGVAKDEIKLSTLRSMASQKGKKLQCTFKVLDHGENGYEVGRLFPAWVTEDGIKKFQSEAKSELDPYETKVNENKADTVEITPK